MNDLHTWAADWHIPPAAIPDLMRRLGATSAPPAPGRGSESKVQSEVRLAAPRHDLLLWRNNVGALLDQRGVPVRYGLCNDSAALNARIKSADLIGLRKRLVTPEMVGSHIGQFTSLECKAEGWRWTGDDHEQAQLRWALIVLGAGGDARFVTSASQI